MPMPKGPGRLEMGHEVYGELCMILPADWPFGKGKDVALTDAAAWPIWMLMELGRFPHVHQIWISYGFILPNTETCEPFSPMTDLSGVIIVQFEGELGALTMADGTTVELLMPILAYKEELDLCDEIGVDAVIDEILESNRGSFALDVRRANVAAGGTYE